MTPTSGRALSSADERVFRSRRHPRPTQFDYLHLRALLLDIAEAFGRTISSGERVLDVYCGTRPYEDLLPSSVSCIGLDVDDRHGVADVVSTDFLPFEDASFDVVISIEAFHYVADPAHGVAELKRVLRPGGRVVIAVPFVWEYDRWSEEHRFSEPTLRALFAGWQEIELRANGGRGVAWATLTGRMVDLTRERMSRRFGLAFVWRAIAAVTYLMVNVAGALLERYGRFDNGRYALPMNLMLTARRPVDG